MVSGSEVAFFSLTGSEIKQCQNSGSRRERIAFKLIQKPKELLATILILNNTINVALVTLTTFIAWGIFGTTTLTGKMVIGLTLVVTIAIVFFGEVLPKVYANQNSLKFVKRTSAMIDVSRSFLKPSVNVSSFICVNNFLNFSLSLKRFLSAASKLLFFAAAFPPSSSSAGAPLAERTAARISTSPAALSVPGPRASHPPPAPNRAGSR